MRTDGKDNKLEKKVTCQHCASIICYWPNEKKCRTVSCMGDIDTYEYIECPDCKQEVGTR